MNPLISFCIPTYNRANFLEETLNSIVHNIKNIPCEIVISDNASSDNTPEVAARFNKDYMIRYVRNDSNIGSGKNLARVIEAAQGKYVWFLGDDDPIADGIVEHLYEMLNSNTQLDYILVPRKLMLKDLSPHPSGIQPSGVKENLFFENGYQLFSAYNGQIPQIMGFYGCNFIRRQLWLDSLAKLEIDYLNFFHLSTILYAIKDRPCAIAGRTGILCRINTSPEVIDSRIWIDYYIQVFIQAIEWGYSKQLCEQTIQDLFHIQAIGFVVDKALSKRDGNVLTIGKKLGCEELVKLNSFWTLMSFLPRFMLVPFLWLRSLRRKLRKYKLA